jgi:hypothetical protein
LVLLAAGAGAKKWDPKKEREVGEKVCAEVDKEFKRWDNEDALKRVKAIADAIAVQTQRPDVQYDVRLLDSPEINAFSIPGGFIYVTRGLVEAVHSDHELAGVLAHEIAHNCTYDALEQAERSQKLFLGTLGAAVLAIILGANRDVVATTAQAGLYVRQGVLSQYSIEIESRADKNAVAYLVKSNYNPVGLLTFMERLAQEERRKMPPDMGVFESHPLSRERVAMLIDRLTAAGVTINRRAVINWRKPEVKEVEVAGGKWPAVTWWDETIFGVVGPDTDKAKTRAEDINTKLTQVLEKGASRSDFTLERQQGGLALVAAGETILVISEADAQAQGTQLDELADNTLRAVRRALTRERFAYEL